MNELAKRWDGIATDLHKWASPLRPSPEDIDLLRQQLHHWANRTGRTSAYVALLGVT